VIGRLIAGSTSLWRRETGLLARRTSVMNKSTFRLGPLGLWVAGQATILAGAAAMAWTHSFVPMALAGSAALMLTVPLVKSIATGRRRR